MAYAPAVPLLWTMIADSSDYSEWKTGPARDGIVFFRRNLCAESRLGHRCRHRRLDSDGITTTCPMPSRPNLHTGIKLLVSVIPGVLYMSCAVFMFFYTIDSKTD